MKKDIAIKFGHYLDEDRYEDVLPLLIDNCIYEIGDETYQDSKEIVNLYKTNMLEGKQKFDQLIWGKSKVVVLSKDQFEVHFTDYLQHNGVDHTYQCKQLLTVNDQLKINKIKHVEFPEARAAFEAFKKKVGL